MNRIKKFENILNEDHYYEKEDKRFFNNLTKYSINICLFVVLPAIVTMCVLSTPIC